jgi:cysteine-rich repeat protein
MRLFHWVSAGVVLGALTGCEGCDEELTASCCENLATGELRVTSSPTKCEDTEILIRGTTSTDFEQEASILGSICGNVCCEVDGVRTSTRQSECAGTRLAITRCPPPCCQRPDGRVVQVQLDTLCPFENGEESVEVDQSLCAQVCCEIDGIRGFLPEGDCLAQRGRVEPGPAPADCGPKPIECGDRVVSAGEECDDGNRLQNDGCDENCQLEAQPAPDMGQISPQPDAAIEARTCACNDEGVRFTIAEGCVGPAFNDATTASFCRSVCTEVRGEDANCTFEDGDALGFPACQVRISCP